MNPDEKPFFIASGKNMCSFHDGIADDVVFFKIARGYIPVCQDCMIRTILQAHKIRWSKE